MKKSHIHEHSISSTQFNRISRHGGKLFMSTYNSNQSAEFSKRCFVLLGNISTNPFTCLHMSTHNTTSREGRLVYQRPKSSSSCKLPNQRTAQMSKYHLTHLVKENFPGFIYKSWPHLSLFNRVADCWFLITCFAVWLIWQKTLSSGKI